MDGVINSIIFTSYATKPSYPTSNPKIENFVISTEYQILKIVIYFFLVFIIIIFYIYIY